MAASSATVQPNAKQAGWQASRLNYNKSVQSRPTKADKLTSPAEQPTSGQPNLKTNTKPTAELITKHA
jgi:hypothetical protein